VLSGLFLQGEVKEVREVKGGKGRVRCGASANAIAEVSVKAASGRERLPVQRIEKQQMKQMKNHIA
jgi:hypothetical protein